MAVYVGPLVDWGDFMEAGQAPGPGSALLVADTTEELHAFAAQLDLPPTAARFAGLGHYPILPAQHTAAVAAGAGAVPRPKTDGLIERLAKRR